MSLDLSLVLLQQGRTAEVKPLAGEMLAFFESQGIEREALAAVRLLRGGEAGGGYGGTGAAGGAVSAPGAA